MSSEHPQSDHEADTTAYPSAAPRRTSLQSEQVGRYRIDSTLGAGGMGIVSRAWDPKLERWVAIKVARTRLRSSGIETRRLLREARTVARLVHPNVVRVLDVGQHRDQVFFAMELIEGLNLRQWLRAETRPWTKTLEVLIAAGRGVDAAHRAAIVHRDLKPSNVLVGRDDVVRVLDFGLAVLGPQPPSETTLLEQPLSGALTQTGAVLGTPPYVAPEQHAGETATPSSDQYSFCVMAWECLFGERPFTAKTMAGMAAAKQHPPTAAPAHYRGPSRRLFSTLRRGLDPDPAKRYPLFEDFLAALEGCRPRRRIGSRYAVAALAIAGTTWAVMASPDEAPGPCGPDTLRAADVWTPARRDALLDHFGSLPSGYSSAAGNHVEAVADQWTARWTQQFAAACQAAPSPATLACLARSRTEMQAVLEVAASSTAGELPAAVSAVARVEQHLDCQQTDLAGAHRERVPAEQREAFEEIRQMLSQARGQLAVGHADAGEAQARSAAQLARVWDDPQLEAEVALLRGRLREAAGDFEEAIGLYEAAYFEGSKAGDAPLATTAAVRASRTHTDLHHLDLADQWIRHAKAASASESRAEFDAEIELAEGFLAYARGEFKDAARAYGRAIAARKRDAGIETNLPSTPSDSLTTLAADALRHTSQSHNLKLAAALDELGIALQAAEDPEAAVALHRRAVQIQRDVLGEHHPTVAGSNAALAAALALLGRHDDALEVQRTALSALENAYGPDHPMVGSAAHGLGVALYGLDRFAEARPAFARATKIFSATLGTSHRATAQAAFMAGHVELGAGEPEAAVERLTAAHEMATASLGADHPHTLRMSMDAADALRLSGRAAAALEMCHLVETALEAERPDHRSLGPRRAVLLLELARDADDAVAIEAASVAVRALEPEGLDEQIAARARAAQGDDPAARDALRRLGPTARSFADAADRWAPLRSPAE